MIARMWRGETTRESADAYYRHLIGNVMPLLNKISGHRGAYVLCREMGHKVEFMVITLWESMEAIREFAGNTPDNAVVEPPARALLTDFDQLVRHYTVIKDLR